MKCKCTLTSPNGILLDKGFGLLATCTDWKDDLAVEMVDLTVEMGDLTVER